MTVYRPLLLSLLLAACQVPVATSAQAQNTTEESASQPTIDPRRSRAVRRIVERAAAALEEQDRDDRIEQIRQLVAWLAHPDREGRAPGSDGIRQAADRIEDAFLGIGLDPPFATEVATPDGSIVVTPRSSYRQPFTFGEQVEALQSRLSVAYPDGSIHTAADDLEVSVYSSTGNFAGPLVFTGYSIVTGGGDYLGFTGLEDFRGKAVIMFSHEPMDELGRSLWSDNGWSFAAPLHRKINAVVRRGAAAVLIVEPPDLDETLTGSPDPQGLTRAEMPQFEVPIVHVSDALAASILKAGDPEHRSLYTLFKKSNKEGTVIDLEGVTIALQSAVHIRPAMTDNVGGLLPGRGQLADEYIVIGAHYDHLGEINPDATNTVEPEIYPGADDNASGTAAMLTMASDLAEHYNQMPANQDARSILFLAFSAEELGLVGARHYVEHPIIPIDDHVFMANFDMVGRYSTDGLQIGGLRSSVDLPTIVEPQLLTSGVRTAPFDPSAADRSDHAVFADKGVPFLVFFTGFHPEYHSPYDTPDLVDAAGIERIAAFGTELVIDLATRPQRLAFDRAAVGGNPTDTPEENEADQRVRVGLIPAARSSGQGMLIARVSEGSSAALGGLRKGDRITAWNGTPISEVADWTALLDAHKPGDKVTVEYTRAGETQTTELILQSQGDE